MDENRHHLAWTQLSCTLTPLACCEATGFPLRLKVEPKVTDSTKQFEYTHFCEVGGWCVALRYVPIRLFPNHACSFHCTWLSGKSIIQMISVIVIPVFSSEVGLHVNRHGRCGRISAFFVYGAAMTCTHCGFSRRHRNTFIFLRVLGCDAPRSGP